MRYSGSSRRSATSRCRSSPPAAKVSSSTHGIVISDGPMSHVKPPSRAGTRARRAAGAARPRRRRGPAPCRRSAAASPPSPAPTTTTLMRRCAAPSARRARRARRPGGDPQLARAPCRPPRRRGRPGRRASSGRARPAARRAEREALGDVDAVAQPARGDHGQARRRRRARRRARRRSGAPSRRRRPRPRRRAGRGGPRSAPSWCRPRPRRRRPRRRRRAAARTSSPSSPKPTSLTTTGSGASRVDRGGDRRRARRAKSGSPSGCTASWSGLRWMRQPVGVEQLDEPRGAARARAARAPARRRGWPAAAAGAAALGAVGAAAAAGSSSSRRPEPSTSAMPCSAAARASRRLISPPSAVPPVIAETTSGAASGGARAAASRSADVGERALGQRAVAQPHALEAGARRACSTPAPAAMRRWSALRAGPRGRPGSGSWQGPVGASGTVRSRAEMDGRSARERLASANPRSSSLRAWSPGVGRVQQHDPEPRRGRAARVATRQRPAASV